jgi:fructose-1,6-bisphosphatase/sedoheptulose 1,7-bisphosphatase-like protein
MSDKRAPNRPLEHDLLFDFLRIVEAAAIEAARTMGKGDREFSDRVAVEKMREVMDTIPMDGVNVTKRRCSTSMSA